MIKHIIDRQQLSKIIVGLRDIDDLEDLGRYVWTGLSKLTLLSMHATVHNVINNPMMCREHLKSSSRLTSADFDYFIGDYAQFKTLLGIFTCDTPSSTVTPMF